MPVLFRPSALSFLTASFSLSICDASPQVDSWSLRYETSVQVLRTVTSHSLTDDDVAVLREGADLYVPLAAYHCPSTAPGHGQLSNRRPEEGQADTDGTIVASTLGSSRENTDLNPAWCSDP